MRMADRISASIAAALDQARVVVIDDSARHHGHAGAREGGESHFKVEVVSPAFAGKTRVARQRLVYQALAGEFAAGVHALEVKTLTPEEAAARGR
jgi:BolA protein